MLFKKITLICCYLLISFVGLSQGRFGGSEKSMAKLKTNGLQVAQGYVSSDLDETLKTAMEKYWTFTPLEFIDAGNFDKNKVTMQLSNYEQKGWTKYTFTAITFSGTAWINYMSPFDNLSSSKVSYGIANSDLEIKCLIPIYVMNLCAQYKFLEKAYAENTKGINKWNGYKDRLKTTTVLIPIEYLNNGLTKNAFKQIRKKEFVSLQDIDQRIKDGKTKNVSILQVYRTMLTCKLTVVDLDNGDFIYTDDFGEMIPGDMVGHYDKFDDKDVIKQIGKMYEN